MSWILHVRHGEGSCDFSVAYHYATSPRRVYKPIGNNPGIEPWNWNNVRLPAPAPNTLDSDNIALGASQGVFGDALAETLE